MYRKFNTFEAAARVPLLIRVPWMPHTAGMHTAALTELVDVFPTLAALAGAPSVAEANAAAGVTPLDGTDLSAVFDAPSALSSARAKAGA